jgi:ElaB/YqjD/DUF883 family membrane-anchored ribosome-binding protein
MTPTNSSPTSAGPDVVKSVGDKISDAATQVKNKVNDLGRTAAEKMEDTRTAAASGLDSTASALHQGGEKVGSMAHSTADKLSGTAEYLRNHDAKSMMADVEQLVKKNPGASLLAAGAIGFLMGRTMRRSD